MFQLPPLETHRQLSPECLVLAVWFCKFPRAEESPWDPAFPGTVLAWDTLLERANRSRQEGGPSWPRKPELAGIPPSVESLEHLCGKSFSGLVQSKVAG